MSQLEAYTIRLSDFEISDNGDLVARCQFTLNTFAESVILRNAINCSQAEVDELIVLQRMSVQ